MQSNLLRYMELTAKKLDTSLEWIDDDIFYNDEM